MKRLFLFSVLLACMAMSAQTFTPASGGGGFDTSTGVETGETILIDGKTFLIKETLKGARFIECLSAKTGNNYAVWLGVETGITYEGRKVYVTKKGKYCVFKLSDKTGNPYAYWLKKED